MSASMDALLQIQMVDAQMANKGSYSCTHENLTTDQPMPFRTLETSLAPQVRCGCDYSTMYLWDSPGAARKAIREWADVAPSVFGPTLTMLDPSIARHTCWCVPRVGAIMLSATEAAARGGPPGIRPVVPGVFHAEGCTAGSGLA